VVDGAEAVINLKNRQEDRRRPLSGGAGL